jgi:hypothetical protein
LVVGRLTVPNIESRCNQLKLGHPLLLKAIQQGSLTVQAADLIKAELETNRFKMSFKSFQELV